MELQAFLGAGALPAIGSDGLALRVLRRQDASDWYAYLRDPAVTRHTSWRLAGVADLEQLITACLAGQPAGPVRLAIADTASDRLRGTIGFNEISAPHQRAEIAYDLAPELWNRGIASCAASRAISGCTPARAMRVRGADIPKEKDTTPHAGRLLRSPGSNGG